MNLKCINIFLLATCCVVFGIALPCFGEDKTVVDFKTFLVVGLKKIQANSSLLVISSNVFWLSDSETNQTDIKEVSYLTSSNNYRTICKWPKPSDGNKEWQGSYDGTQTATFTERQGEIIYRVGESPDEDVVPINPILSPFIFLSRAGDSCSLCFLRVNNVVRGEPVERLEKMAITNIVTKTKNLLFTILGENLDGVSSYWDIEFQANDNPEIKNATRYVNKDDIRIEYSFLNYTNIESTDIKFPTTIVMTDYHGSKVIMTQITYVESATKNPSISENTFSIMKDLGSKAKRVFNVDTERFDKLPNKFETQNTGYIAKRRIIVVAFVVLSVIGLFLLFRRSPR